MTSAYVLRLGKGNNALYLDRMPFSASQFSLTENINRALMLTREEAEQIAAQYRSLKVDFAVEELRA